MATERDFDIPAQPLSRALVEFAAQSDLQLLFAQDDVAGLSSRPVQGRLTPETALATLLPEGAPRVEIAGDRVVRVEPPLPQYAEGGAVVSGDDLVVTGTRIRGAVPAGANVLTLDEAAIAETGRSTVQDVLATLPQNFFGGQNEAAQQSSASNGRNLSFGASVNLRGLGADSTLALVNGRRLAPAGFGHFVDISSIPLAAVSRVEILPDGASATYGADAVGGVVNVILQDEYEGAETTFRAGSDGRGDVADLGLSQLAGLRWRSGGFVVAYEYRDRTDLDWNDRDFTSDSNLARYGGRDYSRTQANPGTITRLGASAVTYAIPTGQNGTTLRQSDLIAGQTNRQNAVEGMDVLPQQRSHAFFASAHQELGPRLEVFGELMASDRAAISERTQQSANIVIPESNYYRRLNNLFLGQ
ncbi:MAG: TonB-dependent receptor, partial [Phycisphaerales bacterium]|nr:TonB-dependent receptor [Hyphomonadaceae bacterium]